MPAEVKKMAHVGQMPWHGFSTLLSEDANMDTWYKESGLDYEVEKIQLQTVDAQKAVEYYATRIKGTDTVLGHVGPSYTPLQNKDSFEWFRPFVDKGLCKLETAGSLRDGARVWVLARIMVDPIEIVPNDEVLPYLLLSNGHDGLMSVRVSFNPIRVVCSNTMAMAHASEIAKTIRVRHSAKVKQVIDTLGETVDVTNRQFIATAEKYRYLVTKGCNRQDMEKFFRTVLDVDTEKKREDLPTRTQNRLENLFKIAESGMGMDIPGVKDSWYGAFNAVTQFYTWEAGRNPQNTMDSLWFGQNGNKVNDALNTALQLAV